MVNSTIHTEAAAMVNATYLPPQAVSLPCASSWCRRQSLPRSSAGLRSQRTPKWPLWSHGGRVSYCCTVCNNRHYHAPYMGRTQGLRAQTRHSVQDSNVQVPNVRPYSGVTVQMMVDDDTLGRVGLHARRCMPRHKTAPWCGARSKRYVWNLLKSKKPRYTVMLIHVETIPHEGLRCDTTQAESIT